MDKPILQIKEIKKTQESVLEVLAQRYTMTIRAAKISTRWLLELNLGKKMDK